MGKTIHAVTVTWRRSWRKWPDTEDRSYDDVLALRESRRYSVGGEDVDVLFRFYPVHRAYVVAGVGELPTAHPYFDNTRLPRQPVIDAMLRDLSDVSRECRLLHWESAIHCYPPVAADLKRMYARSILYHGDDSPGATEIRSEPIAKFFDTVFCGNVIWTATGCRTKDLYRGLGVPDVHYVSARTTGGFLDGLRDHGWTLPDGSFDMGRRIDAVRSGRYAHDLVFAGGRLGPHRAELSDVVGPSLSASGLRVRIHGIGMRDGILPPHPQLGYDPRGLGWPVAGLYLSSFGVLGTQFIGLMGSRVFDAWASGTLLFMHDPVGELASIGVLDGVHYVGYDGTAADLAAKVARSRSDPTGVERILRDGHEFGRKFVEDNSFDAAMGKVLAANAARLGL